MIQELQNTTSLSARAVSHAVKLGYRRLLRWRKRASTDTPVLASPGPKKNGPLPLAEVQAQIAALCHGRKRTRGTTELQAQHRGAISRRDLGRLIAAERSHQNTVRRQVCKHVTWHAPNLAWAIDATERGRDRRGRKLYVHVVQDLCTRYRFAPLAALESNGTAVAAHLEKLFRRHGPPCSSSGTMAVRSTLLKLTPCWPLMALFRSTVPRDTRATMARSKKASVK